MDADRRELVVVGRVVGVHGLRGHLKVRWLGDGPEHLEGAEEIWLAQSKEDPAPRRHAVLEVGAASGDDLRIRLAGLVTREDAEGHKGQWVLVDAARLAPLAEGEFYWYELVGCRVESLEGEEIGVVRELFETGAHDLLVVEAADGRRHMIPTAREFVREIDLDAGRIRVALIPGLIEPAE